MSAYTRGKMRVMASTSLRTEGHQRTTARLPLVWLISFVDMCVIQRYLALSDAIWRYLAQSRAISRNLGRFKVKKIFFACGGRLICVMNCLIPRAELNQAASPGVELGARPWQKMK